MSDIYKGSTPHDHIGMGEDFIQHWKYVKKLKVGKGTRYFYSWDEWRAYLSGDDSNKESAASTKTTTVLGSLKSQKNAQSFFDKIKSNPLDTVKEKANRGKNWFNNKIKKKDGDSEKDSSKKEEPKKQPEAVREEGTDDNGHKYIAKVEIDGKTRYFYSEEELKAYQDRAKYMADEPKFMQNVKHSDVPYTSEEDACMVNPNNLKDERYQVNCAECSAIYELRRRGYDIESNGLTGIIDEKYWKYNTEDRFKIMYENPKTQHTPMTSDAESTYRALQAEFDKNPPGSRGDLTFVWQGGGGHSVVWEKDLRGNVKIIDTQASGSGYHTEYDVKTLSYCMDNSSYGAKYTANITRTDNLKLKKGIVPIYKDSGEKKNKPKGNHIQIIQESWQFNWVTNTNELVLNAIDKRVKHSKDERETKYPEIGSKTKSEKKSANTKPKTTAESKKSSMKALRAAGYSYEEIAKKLGISASTIAKYL